MTDPVPEVLRALRGPEPLWAIEHRIGMDAQGREAIERARQPLGDVPREALVERPSGWTALVKTFPHHRVEAAQRADQLSRLCEHRARPTSTSARSWHGCTGSARSRGSSAATNASSPNKRWPAGPNAHTTTTSRSQSSLRASTPTATSAQPGSTSTATSSSTSLPQSSNCATATARPASAASTTSAATRPPGSPSDWVRDPTTPPRASSGTAPPRTSTTTATPSDSRPVMSYPTAATTASATPGKPSTTTRPRPSRCTPSGHSSSAHRPSSPATSASASTYDENHPSEPNTRARSGTSPPSGLRLERVALWVLDRVDREVDIEPGQ